MQKAEHDPNIRHATEVSAWRHTATTWYTVQYAIFCSGYLIIKPTACAFWNIIVVRSLRSNVSELRVISQMIYNRLFLLSS